MIDEKPTMKIVEKLDPNRFKKKIDTSIKSNYEKRTIERVEKSISQQQHSSDTNISNNKNKSNISKKKTKENDK